MEGQIGQATESTRTRPTLGQHPPSFVGNHSLTCPHHRSTMPLRGHSLHALLVMI